MKSDGASGDLVSYTLVDPVDYGLPAQARLRLNFMEYSFAGFDAVLEFGSGGVTPNFKWVLSETAMYPVDFGKYGYLIDDGDMDRTGLFQISTTGFTSSTDQGSMLISLQKP